MSNGSAAQEYAAMGWRVFPVHSIRNGTCSCGTSCDSPGKHPHTSTGFKEATTDPDTIAGWWQRWPDANVAVATGRASNLWVLDIDNKGSVDIGGGQIISEGEHSLRMFEEDHGRLPDTLTATTGSGGRHYFFSYPEGAEIGNKRIAPAVDTRGEGGYVLVSPSNHLAGTAYRWDQEYPIAPIPIWLRNILTNKRELPVPQAEAGATDICREGGRNEFLFRFGSKLRGDGYDYVTIFGALMAHNHKCQPPLELREVERIARNAATQQINEATPLLDLPKGRATAVGSPDIVPGTDLALSLFDLTRLDLPAIEPIIANVLDRGEGGILAGPPNIGKSWIALQAGLAVATGTKFLDYFDTTQGPVLVIDEEGSERGDKDRMLKLMEGHNIGSAKDVPLFFAIGRGYKLDTDIGRTAVQRMVDRYKPVLVIVDSLVRVHGGDENVSKEMARFFEVSKRLMRDTGVSIVFTHHIRKATILDSNDVGELLRGSTEIRAWPDEVYVVRGSNGPSDGGFLMDVSHVKSRWREKMDPFQVRSLVGPESAMLGFMGRKQTEDRSSIGTLNRIIDAIHGTPGETTPATLPVIASRVGLAQQTIQKHLQTLEAAGKIRGWGQPRVYEMKEGS